MRLKSQALRFEGLYQVPASRDGYSTICITVAAQHFKAPGTVKCNDEIHEYQGIVGCTPTNVPLWEIPM